MTKYQKYAEYRNTESQWIDQIPSHWSMSALKHVLATPMTDGPHETPVFVDEGIPFVSAEAVSSGKIDFNKIRGFITVEDDRRFSQKYKPKLHDVYMIKSGATTGVTAIVETDQNFNIWSPLAAMRCKESFEPYYLLNYLRSDPFQKSVQLSWTFGTQQNIGMSTLENLPVCIPPLMEQRKISSFLTYETAKIDTLIAKQEKLIELLKEKRQSVISHAVTKGLNPDVAMKDSGVEWLGEVPEHWILSKLKWRAVTTSGSTPSTSKYELYYEDGSIPWIRTTDLNNDDLYETPISITPRGVSDTACSVLPVNSILIAMYGGAGSIGKHSLLKFESTINQAVCGVLPSKYFNSDYLHRFYEFYRPFWMIGASGTRKDPNIGQDHIKEALVPLPPLEEQVLIANFITEMQTRYDAITQKAELAIQLMQERRTALISSAVTGKINVSNWQHPNEAKTELSL